MKYIYLAGPMRGHKDFNFPAFHAAAGKLRAKGHHVFNPAEKACEEYGDGLAKNEYGNEALARTQHGFSLREALAEDLQWICRHANTIALLPGWQHSRGAMAEYATAVALELEIMKL